MSEQTLGIILAGAFGVIGGLAIGFSTSLITPEETRRRFDVVVGAIMAYGIYLASALMAKAEFPQYLREHLFDGLAPAAFVGYLIDHFPRQGGMHTAFPRIQRPIYIAVLFFAGGAAVFGLVSGAAVFSSGTHVCAPAVPVSAFCGGAAFFAAYVAGALYDAIKENSSNNLNWFITKR